VVIPPGVDTQIFNPGSLLPAAVAIRGQSFADVPGTELPPQGLAGPMCHDVSLDIVGAETAARPTVNVTISG
jgi:hypothetical protein